MPLLGGQLSLAESDRFGCHLHHLVVPDELERLLQGHGRRWREQDIVVPPGGPHVGELFHLAGVHVDIILPAVLADNHTLVDRITRGDEKLAPRLEVEQGIRHGVASPVGYNGAGETAREPTPVFFITQEVRAHNAGALGIGEKLVTIAYQPPRRYVELDSHPAGGVVDVVDHPAFADGELLGGDSEIVLVAIDKKVLDGLQHRAVPLLIDDLGPAHTHLKSFAPHCLNEDGELELAPALDDEAVFLRRYLHLYCHVAQGLLDEALMDPGGLHVRALGACQRRAIGNDAHGHGGLIHHYSLQSLGVLLGTDSVADLHVVDTCKHHDIAGLGAFDHANGDAVIALQPGDLQGHMFAISINAQQRIVRCHLPVKHPANGKPSNII